MQNVFSSWRNSLQFALSTDNLRSFFLKAWDIGWEIVLLSAMLLTVGALNDVWVQQYLSYTPVGGSVGFSSVYLMAYYDFAQLFFVPFMLQRFIGNEAYPYSYYLKRWLVWYSVALALALLMTLPVRVCAGLMPVAICNMVSSLMRALTMLVFMALPFMVVHHVKSSTDFRGMLRSLWYGAWLYLLELPMILFVAFALAVMFVTQRFVGGMIGSVVPYGGTLFSLYGKVTIAQAGWSLLLSLYHHRDSEHSEAEMVIQKAEPATEEPGEKEPAVEEIEEPAKKSSTKKDKE